VRGGGRAPYTAAQEAHASDTDRALCESIEAVRDPRTGRHESDAVAAALLIATGAYALLDAVRSQTGHSKDATPATPTGQRTGRLLVTGIAPIQCAALADGMREAVPEQEAEDRHAGLEQSEDGPDAQPGAGVDPGDADANGGGEVRQAEGHGDQQ
jgi:hypothetical protein